MTFKDDEAGLAFTTDGVSRVWYQDPKNANLCLSRENIPGRLPENSRR